MMSSVLHHFFRSVMHILLHGAAVCGMRRLVRPFVRRRQLFAAILET
jgi:hypothetical protein